MKRLMTPYRQFVVFLVALLVAPSWAVAQNLTPTEDGFETTQTETFSVTPSGILRVERVVGSVNVSTWDQNQVEVVERIRLDDVERAEAQEYVRNYQSTMEKQDNTVVVRGPERDGWNRRSGQHRFTIRVPQQFNVNVTTAGGSVQVTGPQGRVQARSAGGSIQVSSVTGQVQAQTAGGSLELTGIEGNVQGATAGGSIQVERVTGRLNVRTSGGEIRILQVQSDVSAATSGGSVTVEDVAGTVDARTSGGDMLLRAIDQDVTAHTSGGNIELEDLGGAVEARTSGGDIEGRTLRGRVDAVTSAGDIELDDVHAGVTARTSVGDIEVALALQDFSARNYATSLTANHGDITLVLPPNIPASIEAVVQPMGRWDRDDILSDFPLSRTTPVEEGADMLRSSGDINGGGPRIELRTSGGSIEIRKQQ